MLDNQEIKGEFQENYRYAHDYWLPFVNNAKLYTLAASGYTWSDRELKELEQEGREPLELNIMRRPLQFFSGYLRDNLNSVVISPVEGSDEKTADQLTELSYYVWDKGKGYSTFLDSADESFKSGMSLTGIQMDYSRDFVNGDITFFKRTYNSFFLDPTFERVDLKDCAFAITRDLLDRNLIKQLLPFIDPKVIDEIQQSFRDDKFLSYHPNFTTLSRNRNLIAYDQYYKRVSKKRKFLVDQTSGFTRDITDLDKEEQDKLKLGIGRIRKLREEAESLDISEQEMPPLLEIMDVNRDFVELNIMLNGEHVYTGEDKTGINQDYPFVVNLCYLEPSIWLPSQRVQGIASTMWSAQRQFNKRHMKIVDMMDTSISTGYKYLIGSVKNPEDLQQSGQNRLIGIDPKTAPEGMNSVQELQGGGANPALIEYQQILDQLTLTLANVNESVLGVDKEGNTQISGRLAQVRIGQGLRSNRKIFDNIELSQEVLGSLVLKAIQNNYPPGKVKRILGEEPTPQFYDQEFEQYDAVIKEGIRSKSQRDAHYAELVNLKRDGILDISQKAIAEAYPGTGLTDIKEDLEAQDQQRAEIQQRQTELEQQILEKKMSVLDATRAEKLALSVERKTRADANEGLRLERSSESVQNLAQAALDKAKTITEIAQLKDDRILKVLNFVNSLEQQEAADRAVQDAKIEAEGQQRATETRGTIQNDQSEAAKELNLISSNTLENNQEQP